MVFVPAFFPTAQQRSQVRSNEACREAGWRMQLAFALLALLALAVSFAVAPLSAFLAACAQGKL